MHKVHNASRARPMRKRSGVFPGNQAPEREFRGGIGMPLWQMLAGCPAMRRTRQRGRPCGTKQGPARPRRVLGLLGREIGSGPSPHAGICCWNTASQEALPSPSWPLGAECRKRVHGLERGQSGSWQVTSPKGGARPAGTGGYWQLSGAPCAGSAPLSPSECPIFDWIRQPD